MKNRKNCDGTPVMVDLDFIDWYVEDTEDEEERQAAREQVGTQIEEVVFDRFPGCRVHWMAESEMGSFKAANPTALRCPRDIYESVLA